MDCRNGFRMKTKNFRQTEKQPLRFMIAGLSDMADGIVARKTDSVSEFGSGLDGVADFVFVAVQEGHIIRTGKGIKT